MADIISGKSRFTGDSSAKVVKFPTNDNAGENEDFKKKLNNHRKKIALMTLLIAGILIVSVIIFILYYGWNYIFNIFCSFPL